MSTRRLILLSIIFVGFFFVGINSPLASISEVVDNSEQVGTHNDIAMDSEGFAHICYAAGGGFYFNSTNELKYATNKSGSWIKTTIDNASSVGGYSSIAIDANDNVHISYYDYTNQDLKYATNRNGIWETSTLLSDDDVGQFSSIAIDSKGSIFISFFDETDGALKIIFDETGDWEVVTIDGSCSKGTFNSMVIDNNDHVHISYIKYNTTGGNLNYATNLSGAWVITRIEDDIANTDNSGRFTSIASDTNNYVYIAYYVSNNPYSLKYATNRTGTWTITTLVERDSSTGQYPNIALDTKDYIHVSYYDYAEEIYYYLTNKSGDWVAATLESYGNSGGGFGYNSIAVGQENTIHIVYYDNNYEDRNLNYIPLKPATFDASGAWTFETIGNWVDDPSNCDADEDGSGPGGITQEGNSVTGLFDDIEFQGCVSGSEYVFYGFDTNPSTNMQISVTASNSSYASGIITMEWSSASSTCTGGSDIILQKESDSSSDSTETVSDSGGGGGGCFIESLIE